MQVNIHEAKTQLSRLLELVEEGESVVIARHGKPVAELIRARSTGLPLGIARQDPLVPKGDAWWQPLGDEEAEDWIEGQ
jgi:prevent-host-death family protein